MGASICLTASEADTQSTVFDMDIQSDQLTDLYAILDREEHETAISASGRRHFQWLDWSGRRRFQWLNWFGYGWLVLSSIVGTCWAVYELYNGHDFSCVLRVFVWMTILFSPLSIATYILLFSSAWRSIWSTLKRERERPESASTPITPRPSI